MTDHLGNLVGRHLPLGVFLRDRDLFQLADGTDEAGKALYRTAAAAAVLNWRERVLETIRQRVGYLEANNEGSADARSERASVSTIGTSIGCVTTSWSFQYAHCFSPAKNACQEPGKWVDFSTAPAAMKVAKLSFSQSPFHHFMVTRSPNHI